MPKYDDKNVAVPSDTGKPADLLCVSCSRPATCLGVYEGREGPPWPACDECCGHGNEDGWCKPVPEPAEAECKWCHPHTRVKCAGCGLFKSFAAEPACTDPAADTEEHVRDCPSAAWLREQLRLVGEQAMKFRVEHDEWKRRALAAEVIATTMTEAGKMVVRLWPEEMSKNDGLHRLAVAIATPL